MKNSEICPVCGFPRELCICEKLSAEEQSITIYIDKRRWGKKVTVIEFQGNIELDLDDLLTKAKKKVAAGGTIRDNKIELQGDHRFKLKKFLLKMGIPEENIRFE